MDYILIDSIFERRTYFSVCKYLRASATLKLRSELDTESSTISYCSDSASLISGSSSRELESPEESSDRPFGRGRSVSEIWLSSASEMRYKKERKKKYELPVDRIIEREKRYRCCCQMCKKRGDLSWNLLVIIEVLKPLDYTQCVSNHHDFFSVELLPLEKISVSILW